jgi:cytidylate kinase
MDGRDIGTVILPNAKVKIFLTAAPEARAKRRYDELIEKGMEVKYEDILEDVKQRDYNDMHRDIAPLKQADDAILADTTEIDLEGSIDLIVKIIEENA